MALLVPRNWGDKAVRFRIDFKVFITCLFAMSYELSFSRSAVFYATAFTG
jgi:hypothetical protein